MQALNKYQKVILIFMFLLVAVYTVLYPVTMSKEGFAHFGEILVPTQENGNTVYAGNIKGTPASFTVTQDKTVTFQYGDKVYGPYTAKEDATAVPQNHNMADLMRGVELRKGDEVIFRGGVYEMQDIWWFINQDGTTADSGIITVIGDGVMTDEYGKVIDGMEPTLQVLMELMEGPELQHKGTWGAWFWGLMVCIFTAVTIFFADELFRFNMQFRVYDVEHIQPSDWEIASRYILWTLLPVCAWVLFALGLQ
ncbi:MAG: hypothetical protein J6Q54_02945 [Oscillospiraceae bacterium]|nr:hypothetical protein [Oscillospiraceae bacterium]